VNHEKWNNRDRDTPENIICGIANDGMWFWALTELQRDTTGIPIADVCQTFGSGTITDPYWLLIKECQVVVMREMRKAGFTNQSIANALGLEVSTVAKRIRKHMESQR